MNNYIKRIYHGGGNPYSLIYALLLKHTADTMNFVCDTASSRLPRREIHPGYKKGRDMGDDPVYFEVLENCKQMVLHFGNCQMTDIINAEADDYIANEANLGDTIVSNDRDMWPLLAWDIEILLNASTKVDLDAVYIKFNTRKPKHVWLYKALVGDTSDKIPGKRGFGKAAWEKMSDGEREAAYSALENDEPLEPLIDDQVRMCWKLAKPLKEDSYEIAISQGVQREILTWAEEKGIIL